MVQMRNLNAGLLCAILMLFQMSSSSYLNVSLDLIATYYREDIEKGKTPPRPLIEDTFAAPCYSKEHQRLNFHYMGTVNVTSDDSPCLDKFGSSAKCQTFDNIAGTGCQVVAGKNRYKYCNVCKHSWRGYNACKLPKAGTLYQGDLNVTITGRPCMSWDKALMLSKKIQDKFFTITASTFPDSSIAGLAKCRNPTPHSRDGPWCYLADSLPIDVFKWEYCDPCATYMSPDDPGLKILENDTKGESSRSVLLIVPHIHSCMIFCAVHLECLKASFVRKKCFIYSPRGSRIIFKAVITFGYNKQNVSGPSILRTDQNELTLRRTLWMPNILPMEGLTYGGSRNVTKDGQPCLPWSLFRIRRGYESHDFFEQSVLEALNYCRQTGKFTGGPHCHVDVYNEQHVKSCDVISDNPRLYKSCVLPRNGHLYRGSKSVTVTGRKCMSWVQAAHLSKYLPHLYEDVPNKAFPGSHSGKKHAASFCRNPTPQTRFGPWCFIEYKEHGKQIHSWEYCDVCSKTKPVSALEVGYVVDFEAVRDVLYLDYGTNSEYECHHLCSALTHCSAAIFVPKANRCHIGWRNIVKSMSGLSFNPVPGVPLIYIFRKPCIVTEQDNSKIIRQWCYVGETCYFSDKIEYVTQVKETGRQLCAKHCLESTSCLQYMRIFNSCYIYKQDICSCYSEVNVLRKVVIMVTRCYEYASDETYFENDAAYSTFEADDYHIYEKSALSWVPEEDNGSLVKEKDLLEAAERKKDMGNLDEEGVYPSYLGYILNIVMVAWTLSIAFITFVTCIVYIPYC